MLVVAEEEIALGWTGLYFRQKGYALYATALLQYLTVEVLKVYVTSYGPFWMTSFSIDNSHKTTDIQWNREGNIWNVVVFTVPAGGLAPLGARATAGLAMK